MIFSTSYFRKLVLLFFLNYHKEVEKWSETSTPRKFPLDERLDFDLGPKAYINWAWAFWDRETGPRGACLLLSLSCVKKRRETSTCPKSEGPRIAAKRRREFKPVLNKNERESEGKFIFPMEVIDLDGDYDPNFLSLLEAVEAEALAAASVTKSKRRKVSDQESVEVEGSYFAALRGSRSSLWQQQQREKAKQRASSFTAGRGGGGDGACYKCGASGHWARDCTGAGGGGSGRCGPALDGDVEEKACPCGLGSCLVLTSTTAKNPGRKFYRCPAREVWPLILISFGVGWAWFFTRWLGVCCFSSKRPVDDNSRLLSQI